VQNQPNCVKKHMIARTTGLNLMLSSVMWNV